MIGAKRSGSISEEFNSDVGIESDAEASRVKYLNLINNPAEVADQKNRAVEKLILSRNRRQICKVDGCLTFAHLSSHSKGLCMMHNDEKPKCPTCNRHYSRRKGGL